MKRVFLIGDSIRIGYCEQVAQLMEDRAQVQWPADNCRFAKNILASVHHWADTAGEPEKIDVVHWNCGHHDIARFGCLTDNLSTPEEYRRDLYRIHECLKGTFPNAKQIFALTTPIRASMEHLHSHTTAEVMAYNQVAQEVMADVGVPVNDLFSVIKALPEEVYHDRCHFEADGSIALAQKVVLEIDKLLAK